VNGATRLRIRIGAKDDKNGANAGNGANGAGGQAKKAADSNKNGAAGNRAGGASTTVSVNMVGESSTSQAGSAAPVAGHSGIPTHSSIYDMLEHKYDSGSDDE
jgi:hypothetical protein